MTKNNSIYRIILPKETIEFKMEKSVNRKELNMSDTIKYIAKNLLHILAAAIVGSLILYLDRNVHTELIGGIIIGMVSYMAIDDLIIWVKHIINGNDEEWK